MQIKNSSNSRINIKDNLKIFKKYLKKQKAKIFLGSSIIGGSIILFFPFKNLSKLEISFFGKITNAQELIYKALPSDGVFEPIYNYVKFGNSLADLGYRYIKSNILIPANSMQINIKLDDYQTLLEKRNMALKDGILTRSKDDEVNSIINFNNKNYKVKIRLKGDWVDHIKDDKWSFRIKVRGDKSIMGMKEFSLQHPRSRNYINEYIYHSLLRYEGAPSLRYKFISFL